MKSIRRYLQTSLLLVMISVMSFAALSSYLSSSHEIDELFDARLAQYTRLLSSYNQQGAHEWIPVPVKHAAWVGHKYEAKISFQIWNETRQLASASENALKDPLGPFEEGFYSITNASKPLRVFVLQDRGHWYMAAEQLEIRNELVRDIAMTSVFPAVLGTLVVMILAGWTLSRGFLPLQQLAAAITRRRADDLSALSLNDVPLEVQPLIDSLNALLMQIRNSFEREKRFSADAAHELKTPLAALKLRLANMQAMSHKNDKQELGLIAKSVDDIHRIVEQLLLLNRLEPQHIARVLGPVALLSLCRTLLAQEAAAALDKQQDLQLDAEDERLQVLSDATLLQLLLRNLVHNAVLYTPVGGKIVLRVYRQAENVVIEVMDTGPGIPQAERQRVFERFHRGGGDSHDSGASGSGLGLAIVSEIVRLHGGSISLQDGEGGIGLCVRVLLPAVPVLDKKG